MLLERADKALRDHITPALLDERMRAAKRGVERIRAAIVASGIDTLIVIGDDQAELYTNDNLPSLLIYYGETLRNNPRHKGNPTPLAWWQTARGGLSVAAGESHFPLDAGLWGHMSTRGG